MIDQSIDKFMQEMETIINNRLTTDMLRARDFLIGKLSREPTRDEITSHWIGEQEKLFETHSGNKDQKMAVFREVVRKFWDARDTEQEKR